MDFLFLFHFLLFYLFTFCSKKCLQYGSVTSMHVVCYMKFTNLLFICQGKPNCTLVQS